MDDDGPADSDASASMHEIPRAKKPELPKPPFEQFTHQSIVDAAKCGVNSDTDLSPARMERAWDDLGKQGQQYWEARYGRQVVEFHKENEIWERNHPQLRFTYDPEEGHNFDYKALNFDVAPVAKAFDEFVGKCIDHLFNLSKGPEPTSAESEMPSTRSLSPPPHPLPKVLYRAELYRLRVTWLAGRTRKLRATYLKTFEHDKQMPLTLHSSKEQSDAPIFEVTTFLAAPKMPKKGPLEKIFHPSYSDNDSFSDGPHPEPIRYRPGEQIVASADAGMILTINSESIIEALHSVAPGYPDLAFEGDSLVVAEPYCVLLQFRDEMLEYRDSLLPNSSSVGIELHNNQVADKDIDDFVAKGLGVSDMQVQQNSQQPDHITELYKFLDQRYLNAMNLEKQRWECHEAVCTFEWAWLLFTPGTLVYEEKENTSLPSAFTVESFSLQGLFHYDRHSKRPNVMPSRLDTGRKLKLRHRLRKVTIVLTYLKNDGRKWIPAKKKVKILPFNGERLITNLPIYPAKYRCDPDGSHEVVVIKPCRRGANLNTTDSQYQELADG
ncbi:uncharacterized protein KY384_005030 [Bacidia gigantensis]|uniref:uncharacterized protein n=1 Tax=Bacidia gigantensis TaxID=2732470 RepID=UPI001D0594B1|nr:uncharacterized protein KY384_005030 [Bacidia gigantensis]KAG8530527.1 hypothetical protein KY384_005030 [Bacidia gigantensis]